MKVFLEADFTQGSGAIRWEGVTRRRLRAMWVSVLAMAAAMALVVLPRL